MSQPFDESGVFIFYTTLIFGPILYGIFTLFRFIVRSVFGTIYSDKRKSVVPYIAILPIVQGCFFGYTVGKYCNSLHPKFLFRYIFIYKTISVLLNLALFCTLFLSLLQMDSNNWLGIYYNNLLRIWIVVAASVTVIVNTICMYGISAIYFKEHVGLAVLHTVLSAIIPFYWETVLLYMACRLKHESQLQVDTPQGGPIDCEEKPI